MTDEIRKYVEEMSPVYRPAIFVNNEESAYARGYDQAMYDAQHDLLALLAGPEPCAMAPYDE